MVHRLMQIDFQAAIVSFSVNQQVSFLFICFACLDVSKEDWDFGTIINSSTSHLEAAEKSPPVRTCKNYVNYKTCG